jgi:alpha-N-acetylglucosaminidase
MKMKMFKILCLCALIFCGQYVVAADNFAVQAVDGLVARRVPELKTKVQFEQIANAENNADVFELQTRNGKLTIRGNNGVSMASGLNWYLKHYCNCQITLRSEQLNIPQILPEIKETVRIVSPHQYRYYFNYCCFSYTLAFWDWNDWEKMIDLMALYGVNAPLSVTGQEGVWLNVGKRLGLSDEQMQEFFVGPAYLPFGWMGCIDGWANPLPKTWIDEHVELEKKILARERALGMTPVLQGFTGHAPKALQDVNKDAKLVKLSSWANFPSTYFIDPSTPLFQEVGKIWVEEQTKLFDTNHLYASDTFIEMRPPSNDPDVLRKMGEAIYGGMKAADNDAIWVLQGWIFTFQQDFWQKPQRDAFLRSVPQGKVLCLDLWCDSNPAWSKTESFSGQPWVWSILQNFGGTVSLHGGIDRMFTDLKKAMQQRGKESGELSGIGYIMEGLGWNPLIDEWQSDMIWRNEIPEANDWLKQFVNRRYGKENTDAQNAWEILHRTAYQHSGRRDSFITLRPSLRSAGTGFSRDVFPALKRLLDAKKDFNKVRTYQFDITNISREVFGNISSLYYQQLIAAYEKKDREALKAAAEKMNTLILDIDRLLACDDQFLLGTWLEAAKRWGKTDWERKHYEWNARTIITLWGHDFRLDDYAKKQWSGMFQDYYAKRWDLFYKELDKSLENKTEWSADSFNKKILAFQTEWGKDNKSFPAVPSGENPITVAKELLAKYENEFEIKLVKSLTTNKPVKCSDFLQGRNPENANDGIIETDSYWACDVAKNESKNAWWQVDLEQPQTLGKVVVITYYGDNRSYGFYVEGSLDETNWTILSDNRNNKKPSTTTGYTCEFPPQKIRHLRITQTKNSANTGRHLVEVLAFEK